jgi:hypothetical protein
LAVAAALSLAMVVGALGRIGDADIALPVRGIA